MLFSLSFPEKIIRTAKLAKKANKINKSQRANESTGQQVWGAQGLTGLISPVCLIETPNLIHFHPITTPESSTA